MVKRILLGLADTEFATSSMQRAVELAERHNAEVTAVNALNMKRLATVGPVPAGAGSSAVGLVDYRVECAKESVERSMAEFKEACEARGIDYSVKHEEGDPFDLAINCSRYYDLMVCGLRHLFDDGVTEDPPNALVKMIDAGVRPILAEPSHYREVDRVVVAYSGSMESAKTMKRFVQQKLWPNALLKIVTYGHSEDTAREMLQDASDLCTAHGYEVETERLRGRAARRLLEDAHDWGADLLVVGSSAQRLWLKRVLGSTTSRLIRDSDLPLYLAQ